MADWGNLVAGAAMGIDEFGQVRQQRDALQAGAGMFSGIGTPEAQAFAQLIQERPDDAMILAQQMGGLPQLYQIYRSNAGLDIDPLKVMELGLRGEANDIARLKAEAEAGNQDSLRKYRERMAGASEARAAAAQQGASMAKQPTPQAPTVAEAELRGEYSRKDPDFGTRLDAVASAAIAYRGDIDPVISAYIDEGADDWRARDLALIYSFIKLRDPNAVREGEIKLLQQAGGLSGAVQAAAQYLGVEGGGQLPAGMRSKLMKQIRGEWQFYKRKHQGIRNEFRRLAEGAEYGVRPAQVIGEWNDPDELFGGFPEIQEETPKGVPPDARPHATAPDGTTIYRDPHGRLWTAD